MAFVSKYGHAQKVIYDYGGYHQQNILGLPPCIKKQGKNQKNKIFPCPFRYSIPYEQERQKYVKKNYARKYHCFICPCGKNPFLINSYQPLYILPHFAYIINLFFKKGSPVLNSIFPISFQKAMIFPLGLKSRKGIYMNFMQAVKNIVIYVRIIFS